MKIWTQQQESENLKRLFDELKKSKGTSRAEFNRNHPISGGANMIQQHISGLRPISIESALTYAEGFCVPIKEVSPRVAQFIEKAIHINKKFSPGQDSSERTEIEKVFIWPFESVTKEQYDAMSESDKFELEEILKIKADKNKIISKTGTG